jgi:hypothetical protein
LAGARHYGIERRDDFWNAVGEFLRELEPTRPQNNVHTASTELPPKNE